MKTPGSVTKSIQVIAQWGHEGLWRGHTPGGGYNMPPIGWACAEVGEHTQVSIHRSIEIRQCPIPLRRIEVEGYGLDIGREAGYARYLGGGR